MVFLLSLPQTTYQSPTKETNRQDAKNAKKSKIEYNNYFPFYFFLPWRSWRLGSSFAEKNEPPRKAK
jgi:hypothetical protein